VPLATRGRWFPDFARIWQADVDDLVGGRDKRGPVIMLKHNEVARTLVPKEHQLEYSLDQGWGSLAEFLGKPAPVDELFPNVNEAAEGGKVAARILGEVLMRWVCLLSTVGGSLCVGLRYYQRH
jgi:hypothetical protein